MYNGQGWEGVCVGGGTYSSRPSYESLLSPTGFRTAGIVCYNTKAVTIVKSTTGSEEKVKSSI